MNKESSKNNNNREVWTIVKILQWTTGFLKEKGADSPRLDAEVLLADLLGMRRVDLYLNYDRPLDFDELSGYRAMVRRRAVREPVAYIIGKKEFYSLDFMVNRDVLIPRPETELLVDYAVESAIKTRFAEKDDLYIADIGTGSGAIAVTMAREVPHAKIYAVDSSEKALATAGKNAIYHGVQDNITFMEGDLLTPLLELNVNIDLILANLPYVPASGFSDMAPDVKDYEPHSALAGGADGFDLIKRLVIGAKDVLNDGGRVILEIWPDHVDRIKELCAGRSIGVSNVIKDLSGRDRIVILDAGKGSILE